MRPLFTNFRSAWNCHFEPLSPIISHNDFPIKPKPTTLATTMPSSKTDTRYENSDTTFQVCLTPGQMRFLRDLYGEEASWQQITQTTFNRAVNQMMVDDLARRHRIGAQSETATETSTIPPRASNPLAIPRDAEGNLVEPPFRESP